MHLRLRHLLPRAARPRRVIPDVARAHVLDAWTPVMQLTRAELLGLFSEAAMRHPLPHIEVVAFELLFVSAFPSQTAVDVSELRTIERAEAERLIDERLASKSPEREPWVRDAVAANIERRAERLEGRV